MLASPTPPGARWEVVTGEREGEDGAGVLAGFDQARFTEELYQKRGGQVGKVPTVAKSALDALRVAIPAPVTGDTIEATQTAQGDAALERTEAAQPTQDGNEPANAAPENAEDAQGDERAPEGAAATQEALPEVADAALADAPAEPPADAAPEVAEEAADVAPEAGTEPTEMPAAPAKRRPGRPRRVREAATEAAPELAEAPVVPAKGRARPPRDEVAMEAAAALPPRTRRARVAAASVYQQAAPPAEAPAPAPVAPVAPVGDPSFNVLLRLWPELHPQGQRAVMHFMADLVGE